MVAVPSAIVVSNPADDTVTTVVSDDVQVMVGFTITYPPESFTVAVAVAVSPSEWAVAVVSDNTMLAGT
jgi:hypothetical protein